MRDASSCNGRKLETKRERTSSHATAASTFEDFNAGQRPTWKTRKILTNSTEYYPQLISYPWVILLNAFPVQLGVPGGGLTNSRIDTRSKPTSPPAGHGIFSAEKNWTQPLAMGITAFNSIKGNWGGTAAHTDLLKFAQHYNSINPQRCSTLAEYTSCHVGTQTQSADGCWREARTNRLPVRCPYMDI